MGLKHIDRLKHLIESGKWNEEVEKRVNGLINDIHTVAKNEERLRLKGKLQRKISSAKVIHGWFGNSKISDWNVSGDALEVTVDTTYTGKKTRSRNAKARVRVKNYGFEISGDANLFVYQPSCNIVQVVIPDWGDVHEFIAEEK